MCIWYVYLVFETQYVGVYRGTVFYPVVCPPVHSSAFNHTICSLFLHWIILQVEELSVKHCGSTQQAGLVNPSLLLSDHSYLNEHLTCILSPWIKECRVEGERGHWLNREKEPMLTIALDSKVETDTNRRVSITMHTCVSSIV